MALSLLGGCEPASQRPDLPTRPATGEVDAALLVGTWRCRDLNPRPDQPAQVVTTLYAPAGWFRSESAIPGRGRLGPVEVIQRGRWSVSGNRLVTSEVTTSARASDGNSETDAWARASAELVDALGSRPSASELLRLDAQRLFLRPVGATDPPVIGCRRA